MNATIKAYLALKLAGVPVTDPRNLELLHTYSGAPGRPFTATLTLRLLPGELTRIQNAQQWRKVSTR